MPKSKSYPHRNEVKVGSKSHTFKGLAHGHTKGKPGSGHMGDRIKKSTP